jgi:hypothetical protein
MKSIKVSSLRQYSGNEIGLLLSQLLKQPLRQPQVAYVNKEVQAIQPQIIQAANLLNQPN